MKANELRIGNLIKQGNFIISVNPTLMDDNLLFNCNYKPALLSEKWLLNLGFSDIYGYFEKRTGRKTFILTYDGELWHVTFSNNIGAIFQHLGNPEHVHQLQNLYFALTGEELKINQ